MKKSDLWPNFLIIGAAKSGTTSLYHFLKEHPEVFMPEVKEPQFFSGTLPELASEYAYLNLFLDKDNAKVWGESSVAYLSHPPACARIHVHLGDSVKLICLLRNPIRTIYSRWGQLTKMHLETRPPEEAILDSFGLKGWDSETDIERYAWAVDYATHLARYYRTFPKSQVKVFFFEEFFRPGLPMYGDLCRFLGVSDSHVPENVVHNRGQVWKTTFMSTPLWKLSKAILAPVARRLVPQTARARLYAGLEKWNKVPLPPMSPALEAELKSRLQGPKRNLEELLHRDLSQLWF